MTRCAVRGRTASGPTRLIRVLVAERDARLRMLLGRVLGHDNRFIVVGEVASGEDAISYHEPYDVVLLDLRISGLGGLGTLERLRRRTPQPAVVILSDTGVIYLRHAAAAEGAAGYLVAGEDLDTLGDRLEAIVGEPIADGAAVAAAASGHGAPPPGGRDFRP